MPSRSRAAHPPRRARAAPLGGGAAAILGEAVATGTLAAVAATAALALAARSEGEAALRPATASGHWLIGPSAGRKGRAAPGRLALGVATNHAAAIFWALPFAWWRRRRTRGVLATLPGAAATAGLAAAVDYGLMPRRLTPGWELALAPRGVVAGFGGLALGLAAGGLLARSRRTR